MTALLDAARGLRAALDAEGAKAEAEGTQVKMHMPFEPTLDELERKFYAAPRPAPPPKQAADDGTLRFQGSGDSATVSAN